LRAEIRHAEGSSELAVARVGRIDRSSFGVAGPERERSQESATAGALTAG